MTSSPIALSRLPVGSSARRILGPPTIARAIATRCCWPPESCVGDVVDARREADALEGGEGQPAALLAGHLPVEERDLDVVEDRKVVDEMERLEDEPDLLVAQVREVAVRVGRIVAAVSATRPRVGASRRPITFRSVLFPDPDGPMTDTNSPGAIVRFTFASATVSMRSVR